jgi:hypothetical protein
MALNILEFLTQKAPGCRVSDLSTPGRPYYRIESGKGFNFRVRFGGWTGFWYYQVEVGEGEGVEILPDPELLVEELNRNFRDGT